ncbi:uncharacterized protein PV09_00711 [Verruconis gallopava]|uniref:Uncharacterized protein n=1 Tax=Verruconis gallopava TaxID=253628 RepID=A0A0D2AQ00_9PEZI|nr:uncharacterized protein PV09_00711 [Verruconis gallopava]KIW08773.1 hypothetical protein PV09_00711 [Verruconis gallopava]
MPKNSPRGSEAKPDSAPVEEAVVPGFESKPLIQQLREWRAAQKAAKEEGLPRASVKNFFRVLSFGDRLDTVMMLLCGVTSLAAGVSMPLMFLILGKLVNNFTGYFIPGSGVTKSEFMQSVSKNSLIIFGLFWARFIFSYISMYCIRVSGLRISAALRLAYIKALFTQPQAVVDAVPPGVIASRITASSNIIQMGISQQFAIFLQAISLLIGAYIVAFTKAWLLTLVASASLPAIMILYVVVLPYAVEAFVESTRWGEQASALSFEIFTSIRIVAAFCAENRLSAKHKNFLQKKYKNDKKLGPLLGLAFAPPTFAMFSTFALTFYFGVQQYIHGRIGSIGDIIVVLFSVMMGVMAFSQIIGPLVQMARVASAAADILATLDIDFPDMTGLKEPQVSSENDIHFDSVSFAYPSRRDVQVLDNVSMTFETRRTTAIVGPSGSGKSTVVGLLERWYSLDDYQVPKQLKPRETKQENQIVANTTQELVRQTVVRYADPTTSFSRPKSSRSTNVTIRELRRISSVRNSQNPIERGFVSKIYSSNPIEQGFIFRKARGYDVEDVDYHASSDGVEVVEKQGDVGVTSIVERLSGTEGPARAERPRIGGRILIGNVDLATIDAKWWRSQIGLVQQEPFLFNDTIYTNVAYGLCGTRYENIPEEEKDRMVEEACRLAFADEFIARLPHGYKTNVGESGIKLSGGQRQRIAIARAIVKKPSILILDEATSAIDVRTEKIVQAALDRASEGRTTIVIAHRLATIKKADKIIVLRKGQVMEEGTHTQLLKKEDGIYRGLVRAQNIAMGVEYDRNEEDDSEEEHIQLIKTKSLTRTGEATGSDGIMTEDGLLSGYRRVGFMKGFGQILLEQKQFWPQYTLTIAGCCAAGAAFPLQAFIFAQLVNAFTLLDLKKLEDTANHWALMFFILASALLIVYFVLAWSTHWIGATVTKNYRQEYLENILRKRIVFFDAEGNSPGSIASRLSSDPEQIEMVLGAQMSMAYVSVFNLIGSLAISFYYGWKLSLVGTCIILPLTLGAGFVRVRLELKFEDMNAKVFAASSQFAVEAVGAFRTVTSLILESTITDRYDKLMTEHVRKATIRSLAWTLAFALSNSVDMACQAFMLWYGGTLLASREYGLVQYFVIFQAIVQGGMAAGIWFSFAPNIANATAGLNRILSSRVSTPEIEHEVKFLLPPEENPDIHFNDVHFSYKSRNLKVLTGLNLEIQPGQFVALVGATGCGKSTTISLLERFYDTDEGAVMYGSQDIKDLNVPAYRANMSLVAQESTLYEGSIRENVCLSVDMTEATEGRMYEACKAAQIHDFIVSLPEGYSTYLGPKGVSLSGGQRQRLALARALMRDPHVLLLDEATSSLDSESEKLVQEAIEKAAGDGKRTIIAVAHRLATIQKADIIYVLGSGKVLERGNHQELLKARGVYFSMCQAQALDR